MRKKVRTRHRFVSPSGGNATNQIRPHRTTLRHYDYCTSRRCRVRWNSGDWKRSGVERERTAGELAMADWDRCHERLKGKGTGKCGMERSGERARRRVPLTGRRQRAWSGGRSLVAAGGRARESSFEARHSAVRLRLASPRRDSIRVRCRPFRSRSLPLGGGTPRSPRRAAPPHDASLLLPPRQVASVRRSASACPRSLGVHVQSFAPVVEAAACRVV